MKTNQEAFTKIVNHLRKQGAKAINSDGDCAYYDEDTGMKCAAGCLIDQEYYSVDLEGKTSWSFGPEAALASSGWGDVDQNIICSMQFVHDNCEVDKWEGEFVRKAYKYNLVVPDIRS